MVVDLVVIDPQNDFCDKKNGSLYVEGAWEDSHILGEFIEKNLRRITNIRSTFDQHQKIDISHPLWWVDFESGKQIEPFSFVSVDDVESGKIGTYNPGTRTKSLKYLRKLAENGRYDLQVWPEHCIIGNSGSNNVEPVAKAYEKWCGLFRRIDYLIKGSNPWTEHYSAIQADVTDPDIVGNDMSVQLNTKFLENTKMADIILFAGWASSHCGKFTIEDTMNNFGPEHLKKMVILSDCMSPVGGSHLPQKVQDMYKKAEQDMFDLVVKNGGTVCKSTDFSF